ncbi:hypothetical protein FIA58_009135 [Flavobacterium jejuense]|uniref:Uncharacterized protein n=1 Tax=Flavobacterium jejuense TaxID=1544455 RepID=A0ABX0IQI5_9FLAO|nr:hypothetical protein [Flavobacterium jejuense]NHN25836.1 hypothetical protein [Flavobacterium jejuense]
MKYFFGIILFLLIIFSIPFVSLVLVLTSPFILIYKIKVLNKPKATVKKKEINPIDFIFNHKGNFLPDKSKSNDNI